MSPHKSSSPVALVTGAASPLGSAISRQLAGEGFNLALHYGKSKAQTLQLQKELASRGIQTFAVRGDLSKPSQAHTILRKTTRRWGRLDLLVNNAGLFKPTPLRNPDWKDWMRLLSVNSFSPCALAIAARPWLQAAGGCIINITDIYGESPILKDHAAYSASKAALLFLTKFLAVEFAPEIRVNAVSPGVISFPGDYSLQKKKMLVQRTALKRQGTPEEIAGAVWSLASNRFVTGQVLKVDGGRFVY